MIGSSTATHDAAPDLPAPELQHLVTPLQSLIIQLEVAHDCNNGKLTLMLAMIRR